MPGKHIDFFNASSVSLLLMRQISTYLNLWQVSWEKTDLALTFKGTFLLLKISLHENNCILV